MLERKINIQINQELCDGCGLCVGVCPSETISVKNKKAQIQSSGHLLNLDAFYAALNTSCKLVPGYKNFSLFTSLQSSSNALFSRLLDIV